MDPETYEALVRACTRTNQTPSGYGPYDYQRRIADDGLPVLLNVPTGAGKTMAMVLGWLWRRRFHPDALVRASTPHWLVFCQPMRTLVEQVERDAIRWLANAGLANQIDVHVFMGGEPTKRTEWRDKAHRDAIVIGTQDMLLSRALNRGFGSSRYLWPVEFAVMNNGVHWVFDEIQLMGVAVPTSRQLDAFRTTFGAALNHGSTWMSATVDTAALVTIDNPVVATSHGLSDDDRSGPLGRRLQAEKTVHELILPVEPPKRAKSLAESVVAKHRSGSLSLAIVNTVAAARDLEKAIRKISGVAAEVVLVHSRFRPGDRAEVVGRVIAQVDPMGPGRIVVSTQVVEAGMDLDATILHTDAAPWASIVQRMGRCNRTGDRVDAEVWWSAPAKPDKPLPYEAAEVRTAAEVLRGLESQTVVPDGLAKLGPAPIAAVHPVLRRRDLLALFDTMPDIAGSDVDVSPYVRDESEERTVHLAWRQLDKPEKAQWPRPTRDELCPVPIGEVKTWAEKHRVWTYEVTERAWSETAPRAIRPNMVLLADVNEGGYTPDQGWNVAVANVVPMPRDRFGEEAADHERAEQGEVTEAIDDDSASFLTEQGERGKGWVRLGVHLLDTELAARTLLADLGLTATDEFAVVVTAARLHDLGKAHGVFQNTMLKSAQDEHRDAVTGWQPLAKSGGRRATHERRHFRHELATALALLDGSAAALEGLPEDDRFLAVYLTAAHHGRIRMNLRSMPGEDHGRVFGIADSDVMPDVNIGGQIVAGSALVVSRYTGLGLDDDGHVPWFERAADLLDRFGPFRLAHLEALVRFADWRSSSDPSEKESIDA